MNSEPRGLNIWNHTLRPILRYLYFKLNPHTRAEIDKLFSPFLVIGNELYTFYHFLLFIFIEWFILFIWLDMYYGNQGSISIGSFGYYFCLFGIGMMAIFMGIALIYTGIKSLKNIIRVAYIIIHHCK